VGFAVMVAAMVTLQAVPGATRHTGSYGAVVHAERAE